MRETPTMASNQTLVTKEKMCMKDIDDVLTGYDAITYFLDSDNEVEDYESIWCLDSYKKSIRRHLLAIVPSLIFIVLLGLMFFIFLSYSPNLVDDLAFIIMIVAIVFTLIYFVFLDLERFRQKHIKFIKGNVVGTSKDDDKIRTKYYLIFMIDNADLIAAQVSKKDYVKVKPNDEFLIFLEGEGLFAVRR